MIATVVSRGAMGDVSEWTTDEPLFFELAIVSGEACSIACSACQGFMRTSVSLVTVLVTIVPESRGNNRLA